MTKDEALRLALEALTKVDALCPVGSNEEIYVREAIYAIKAALEAKDEPVAHSVVAGALFDFMGWLTSREKRLILSSVDEASPAVEAITEFAKKRNLSLKYAEVGYWMEFLSTPPQQEAKDEPVAWMYSPTGALFDICPNDADEGEFLPLYTTSPQRTWVKLTEEEIKPCWYEACQTDLELTSQLVVYFARAIEAKLKEKNG